MTSRTLQPRDLDPRTLRVVRSILEELARSLGREADDWRRVHGEGDDVDYASGLLAAAFDLAAIAHGIKSEEKSMRARIRRRQQ